MANRLWPLYDLKITTPRLVIRLANDHELFELAQIADESMFENQTGMPFSSEWAMLPSPDRELSVYQFHTKSRAEWKPQDWMLPMTAFTHDGRPIGTQTMLAKDFGDLHSVSSGSWLGATWQRKGYGTEMRAAILELAFAELGAVEAHSSYREGNAGSHGVSAKLGYEANGEGRFKFGDEAGIDMRVRLTRQAWQENRALGVEVEGIDSCRSFFGGDGETWQTV